jgi:hypothetical protein
MSLVPSPPRPDRRRTTLRLPPQAAHRRRALTSGPRAVPDLSRPRTRLGEPATFGPGRQSIRDRRATGLVTARAAQLGDRRAGTLRSGTTLARLSSPRRSAGPTRSRPMTGLWVRSLPAPAPDRLPAAQASRDAALARLEVRRWARARRPVRPGSGAAPRPEPPGPPAEAGDDDPGPFPGEEIDAKSRAGGSASARVAALAQDTVPDSWR